MKRVLSAACFVGLVALWGCGGPVISKELRAEAVPIQGLEQVRQDPGRYQGKTIIVGGEIIHTINHPEETTTLLVLDYPLGHRQRPRERELSQGRFMVEVSRFLDPEVFDRGKEVTVAGVVEGTKTRRVGKTPYKYVVIKAREVHLWPPERQVYVYPAYPYWDYGPGWWGWAPGGEGFEGEENEGGEHEEGEEGGEGGEHGGEGGEHGGEGGHR